LLYGREEAIFPEATAQGRELKESGHPMLVLKVIVDTAEAEQQGEGRGQKP
jgi:hypothetical protein